MKRELPTVAAWVFGICFLTSCAYMPDIGKILPDKKSEYKKSESMPDLEIPPDLTADAINDSMNIPNEAPVTLSRYRNPRTPGSPGVSIGTTEADEQLLSLAIPVNLLWPDLVEFVESKNYTVELEDSELGVLETGWSQADEQTGLQYRYKYRIFAEPGDTADASVLIISQERQTRLDDNSDWLDQGKDTALERQFAADLSLFIGPGEPAGGPATAVAAGADSDAVTRSGPGKNLRVVDAGEGKMYLSIPEAFELAWKNTGLALRNSGLQVVGGDADKGFYLVTGGAPQRREKKGFFSRLAFWKGDGNADASWQINLTGVGNRTELIVVNEDDEWEATDDAARILALIRDRYPVK
ncbi:MAG: outer membrane protein assembly factor BamC [Gammaproteobacteria bacterium]|nr:outer membrane protein assembly factor BamC [Gammaproteobacteria bacterium]